jgi:hypothetical protein
MRYVPVKGEDFQVRWDRIKRDLTQFQDSHQYSVADLATALELSTKPLAYRLDVIRGIRENYSKAEKPRLIELMYVEAKLKELRSAGNGRTIEAGWGFRPGGIADARNSQDAMKAAYVGNWIGMMGSAFYPGKYVLFSLSIELASFGFAVIYKQVDMDTKWETTYAGYAYFMLFQLWLFIQERNNKEFVAISLQRPNSDTGVNWMPGVYVGRGGTGKQGEAHPAAGKVCIMRESECREILPHLSKGWVYKEELETMAPTKAIRHLTRYATGFLAEGDHVLRGEMC